MVLGLKDLTYLFTYLAFSSKFFCLGIEISGFKLEPRLATDNGWQKLITEVNSAGLSSSGESFVNSASAFVHDYTNFSPTISLNGDICQESPYFISSPVNENSLPLHIPMEKKSLSTFIMKKHIFDFSSPNFNFHIQYPRVKHFKNKLPELIIEPYQRLFSFAIEICMIPSIWYLEVIHCMYVGTAPHFTGVLMNYSLQDIVGSSVLSLGFLDEQFSIENCKNAVSNFGDDQISVNYEQICERVENCLLSRPLENGPFSKFRNEFEERIQRTYRPITPLNGFLSPRDFARFVILTSISTLPNSKYVSYISAERNFLPIRAMLCSLSYYGISGVTGLAFRSERRVAKVFSTKIQKWLTLTIPKFKEDCVETLQSGVKDKNRYPMFKELFDYFCQEIFSSGFIFENIKTFGIEFPNTSALYPQRILQPQYFPFIPSLTERKLYSEYDNSWIQAETEILVIPKALEKPIDTSKQIFSGKQYRKTRRKGASSRGVSRDESQDKQGTERLNLRTRLSRALRTRKAKDRVGIMNHVRG
ncbi:putative secreted protein [Cryptosporidium felis]|nr:putative secreted protein [Cryptosporidium felis]